jgi:hypothetical protein
MKRPNRRVNGWRINCFCQLLAKEPRQVTVTQCFTASRLLYRLTIPFVPCYNHSPDVHTCNLITSSNDLSRHFGSCIFLSCFKHWAQLLNLVWVGILAPIFFSCFKHWTQLLNLVWVFRPAKRIIFLIPNTVMINMDKSKRLSCLELVSFLNG